MQDLWATLSKYPSFIFGVLLGVGLNLFQPIVPLLKRPVTAVLLIGILIALMTSLSLVLRGMLGLDAV
jgi:hypothetical protein